jgi:hypothetical protein
MWIFGKLDLQLNVDSKPLALEGRGWEIFKVFIFGRQEHINQQA